MSFTLDEQQEWLEADGRGGFASGTATGVRTRRYHALLLSAQTPPTNRFVLVNGFDATLVTPSGEHSLSKHRFVPDIETQSVDIKSFSIDPWPTWTYRITDGIHIKHEILVCKETGRTLATWRLEGPAKLSDCKLKVRPLLSGRDLHALHHENSSFEFKPDESRGRLIWTPYSGVPAISVHHNGAYEHAPCWYRQFQYDEERRRGFDFKEDLAAPGILEFDLTKDEAVVVLASDVSGASPSASASNSSVAKLAAKMRECERKRRSKFSSPLERAADDYIVRRGEGSTIIAGYPWFTDWGRDTFISVRGLCLATGRLAEARSILLEWAKHVSPADSEHGGLLPNRFPDRGEGPEYNSVDAALWFIIAAHELANECRQSGSPLSDSDAYTLQMAIQNILIGYSQGTMHAIRVDEDGLLAAGQPGVQLTWMDARVGNRVITPRIGKPVEIQALWLNALRIGALWAPRWVDLLELGAASFAAKFWNEKQGCLYDVVDVNHVRGAVDDTLRPNQILAAGGLPIDLLTPAAARMVVDRLESALITPMGLRSLGPADTAYEGRYEGGPHDRDARYHQGTVWPWLIGPFVEAWVRARGDTAAARLEARQKFLAPLQQHLGQAGLGHISEIADGDLPHVPRGCPFQAWSLAEYIRLDRRVLAPALDNRAMPIQVQTRHRAAPAGQPRAAATVQSERTK